MFQYGPCETVFRMETEERLHRSARTRQWREAREERAESGPSGSVMPHIIGVLRRLIRLDGRAAPLPRV
jgi:hypothetical protein